MLDPTTLNRAIVQAFVDGGHKIDVKLYIRWEGVVSPVNDSKWYDESPNISTIRFSSNFTRPGNNLLPSSADTTVTITLDNEKFRYSPFNTTGLADHDDSIYDYISGPTGMSDKRIRIDVLIWDVDGSSNPYERLTIFYGTIKNSEESSDNKSVTLYCHDQTFEILQAKFTSEIKAGKTPSDLISEIMERGYQYDLENQNSLITIPFWGAEDTSAVILGRELAAVENGRFYHRVKKENTFAYKNYQDWAVRRGALSPDFDFDSSLYKKLSISYPQQRTIGKLSLSWNTVREGGDILLYNQTEPILVEPGGTTTFNAVFKTMATSINKLRETGDKKDYFFASAGGVDMSEYGRITVTPHAYSAKIWLTNTHDTMPIYLVRLKLWGKSVSKGADITSKITVNPDLIEERKITSTSLIQNSITANLMLESAKSLVQRPFYVIRLSDAAFLPFLEIGDYVSLTDEIVIESDEIRSGSINPIKRFFVFGITHTMTLTTFSSVYTLIPEDCLVFGSNLDFQFIGTDTILDDSKAVYV